MWARVLPEAENVDDRGRFNSRAVCKISDDANAIITDEARTGRTDSVMDSLQFVLVPVVGRPQEKISDCGPRLRSGPFFVFHGTVSILALFIVAGNEAVEPVEILRSGTLGSESGLDVYLEASQSSGGCEASVRSVHLWNVWRMALSSDLR